MAPRRSSYDLIRTWKSEYVSNSDVPKVKIRRDSFGPPSAPAMRTYSYGPGFSLKGVSVSGHALEFDKSLANFIEVSAYVGVGSCPWVFSYDDRDHEWIRHGKIIDSASAREKETTQRLAREGLVTRFKIREEEPEMTFVHQVRLELTLNDGQALILKPRNRLRPESADHYDKIEYGAEREYVFDLPAGVDPAKVLKSTLAVTGYYLHYPTGISVHDESGK